ncbi:helix-turn-helix domain-containing protein [Novipirellula sp.]|uniref:helix-turn-helix domain-containing protein n=1 Tax=Novipirellula sp. TaxID=2795430 RepID=UPI00356684AB
MADLSITASMSPEDRAAIVADLVAAMRPLLAEAQEPRLVDGDRMAKLVGVSRPMIDRLRARDVIPSVMVGRCRRYRPDAVIDALESQEDATDV